MKLKKECKFCSTKEQGKVLVMFTRIGKNQYKDCCKLCESRMKKRKTKKEKEKESYMSNDTLCNWNNMALYC